MKLICLPYAGAGAGVYQPWRANPSDALTAVPIQVPGREDEYGEPFYTSVAEAAAGTARRVLTAVGDEPFAIFGHSFGAVLAYETAQWLVAAGGPRPVHLIVSGSVSPRHRRHLSVSTIDDDDAVADMERMAGQPIESLRHPDLRRLLLPVMRADVALLGAYQPSTSTPLPMPITAIRGESDALAPAAEWRDWAHFTASDFTALEMSGGHMYLTEMWDPLRKTIEGLLCAS